MSQNTESFEVIVKIKINCFNQDDANHIADCYAAIAKNYKSIDAEISEVISVIKLDD